VPGNVDPTALSVSQDYWKWILDVLPQMVNDRGWKPELALQ
jgi:hypothetical protein